MQQNSFMRNISKWICPKVAVLLCLLGVATLMMAAPEVPADSLEEAMSAAAADIEMGGEELPEGGFQQVLKTKFVEGGAGFMSLVALALILGLAFCIERIIYLSLSEIDAKQFMGRVCEKVETGDVEGALLLCLQTRGPVATLCCQVLKRYHEKTADVKRALTSYAAVQTANLERGCSWITLCITIAPSLGFLGTVIGMVMAFDQIQMAGDINPSVVASGMRVALITTIFGIISALVLQVFYNFIISKIDHISSQMAESMITLMDVVTRTKLAEKEIGAARAEKHVTVRQGKKPEEETDEEMDESC